MLAAQVRKGEMLRPARMLETGMLQIDVANTIDISKSVPSRLWSHYRVTGSTRKRHHMDQSVSKIPLLF